MKISFFEEYPSTKIKSNFKIYIAAKSLKEFNSFKLKDKVYWVVLNNKEGYWISPFSDKLALVRVFNELKNKKVPVMLDLELPFTRNKFLFITQLFNCFGNNKLINDFINNYTGDIYTCEYLYEPLFLRFMHKKPLRSNHKVIKMIYTSMHNCSEIELKNKIRALKNRYGSKLIVGLGTIATGILGNEPILTPKQLERDLKICKSVGVSEVVIFRLGGLNKGYMDVIKKLLL